MLAARNGGGNDDDAAGWLQGRVSGVAAQGRTIRGVAFQGRAWGGFAAGKGDLVTSQEIVT